MRRGATRTISFAAAVAAIVAIAGCGSGARQDASEPSGKFPVQVVTTSWPSLQRLAQHTRLTIKVRNAGTKTIPNIAVTICNTTCTYPARVGQGTSVAAFARYLDQPGLASHSRQVWIIDRPPGACGYSCLNGGAGADVSSDANTWAAGSLRPGATVTFSWRVTAVQSGRYVVAWEIAAGLNGKAKAVLQDGSTPRGTFAVRVAQAPSQSYVNSSGQVVQGTGQ